MIKPQFESAMKFSEGLAKVQVGGRWGYVDKTAQVVIKPLFDEVHSEEGDCQSFSDGLACIEVNEKVGYIDRDGRVVIQPQYDVASPFNNGVAAVAVGKYSTDKPGSDIAGRGDKWGYIDKNGRYVWQPTK